MEKIGKYEILEKLGQGGMGIVYKAHDPLIDRIVAVKTLSAELLVDLEVRKRFLREARSAGQLSHKNIITIYDMGEENGRAYIVMEYLEGEDLKTTISKGEPMSPDARLRVMIDVCEGLAHAHEKQVIHRDIKPGNIFITRSGQAKILDFGLARIVSADITRITKSGQSLGTPHYMSPEQIRGEKVDHRTDIFSAGLLFYELLTYRRAFEGDAYASIISMILKDEPVPMQRIDPAIPHEFSDIVKRALRKEPEKRYQAMNEMLDDLEEYRRSREGIQPRSRLANGRDTEDQSPTAKVSPTGETPTDTVPSLWTISDVKQPPSPADKPAAGTFAFSKRHYLIAALVALLLAAIILFLLFRGGIERSEAAGTAGSVAKATQVFVGKTMTLRVSLA